MLRNGTDRIPEQGTMTEERYQRSGLITPRDDDKHIYTKSPYEFRSGLPHPAHRYDVGKVAFADGEKGGSTLLRYDTGKSGW